NGRLGATPISTVSWPFSRAAAELLSELHFTKKASSAVFPTIAPRIQSISRKPDAEAVISFQSCSLLGSNTTHCSEISNACSIIERSRRTLTNRQAGSLLSVRDPKTRMPLPGNTRRQFTELGLRKPCWLADTSVVNA